MAEMIVDTPLVKAYVDDYDIVSVNGMMLPITINASLGDMIEIGEEKIIAHLTAKPSINDPSKVLPAELVTVFVSQVFSIQKRTREISSLTPEQQFEWDKTIQEITRGFTH